VKSSRATTSSKLAALTEEQRRIVLWIRKAYARWEPLNINAMKRRAPEVLAAAFEIKPFWGWRRAIEAAGLRYEKIPVELEETVRCEECGREYVSLNSHLRLRHGFEPGEYQEAYPGAAVQSEAMRARRGLSPGSVAAHWEPVWSPEYLLDRVSYYHELGVAMNRKSETRRDPALMGMAILLFPSWDEVLEAVGIEPKSVRLKARRLGLSKEELLEALRKQAAAGLPMNPAAVFHQRHGIWTLSRKHFGSYRQALAAAGLEPDVTYLTRRHDQEDLERLAARARRVAAMAGGKWRTELDRLHREYGGVVQKRYGGWWELARRLGLPPRSLVRGQGWDRAAVLAALRERERQGKSLRPGDIHVEEKGLYLAVVRYFGTFEDCYDLLGFPRPPVAIVYGRELRDPRALVERIQAACRAAPGTALVTGTDMVRYTRLAWLARHHFGSWDEGLRRAGLRGVEHLDVLRYADPQTLDADLKRLVEGKLRAGRERRRTLFRYAARLRGSVVGALEAVGASRKRALAIEASPWPEYPSGRAVLAAIEGRRRQGHPIDFRGLTEGSHPDRPLLRAGKFLFGSWEEALRAGAEPLA
jgi:hypothetical protein